MDAWVIAETSAGRVHPAVLELISEAARLVAAHNGDVTAVAFDQDAEVPNALAGSEVDRVISITDLAWDGADVGVPAAVLAEIVADGAPDLVLIAATALGRDLAPRLAVRAGIGLVEDCTYLRIAPDGVVHGTRYEADGDGALRVAWIDRPGLATVPPGTFRRNQAAESGAPELIEIVCPEVSESQVALVSERPIDPGDLPLEDVPVVVAGGLGLGSREGFDLLSDLAAAMGGKVGASRRATDLGWASRDALVGQTGKTVEPALYLACGISGASQHVLGMKDSGYIVSINEDPHAPIHGMADLAVVADALELVPIMTRKFQALSSEDAS